MMAATLTVTARHASSVVFVSVPVGTLRPSASVAADTRPSCAEGFRAERTDGRCRLMENVKKSPKPQLQWHMANVRE